MNDFPPLPERHFWTRTGRSIRATNTAWGEEESIYYAETYEESPNKLEVQFWRLLSSTERRGEWVAHSVVDTLEDAQQIMAQLCWLGVSEYTLKEI